jgi:O-antigen/teichoic acid export membrane protein
MKESSAAATRSLFKNSVSQILGRLLLSALRLVAAALIVRTLGAERFGEYTLVIGFVLIFEWLADFGQTDIVVREASHRPEHAPVAMQALVWLKLGQAVVLALALPALLAVMGYSRGVVEAAAAGALGLLCYTPALIFRAGFKVRMQMERDVLAEVIGAVVILPLTWLACTRTGSTAALVGSYAVSRLIYLAAAAALSPPVAWPKADPAVRRAAIDLVRWAAPLGLSGLIVWLYDSLAPVLLSKIVDMKAVAYYSAPARYIFAIITVVQALNTAFFPMLARHWRKSLDYFAQLQQTALETSMLIGIGFSCAAVASATFLMSVIGKGVLQAAPVLQLMCGILLVRTVSTAMSPLIVISGRQGAAMVLTVLSVALQGVFVAVLVPRYGAMGAVFGNLLVEVICVVPMIVLGQRASGAKLRWRGPLGLLACGIAAVLITRLMPIWGDWGGGMACPLLFVAFCFATGGISVRKLQRIVADLRSRGLTTA